MLLALAQDLLIALLTPLSDLVLTWLLAEHWWSCSELVLGPTQLWDVRDTCPSRLLLEVQLLAEKVAVRRTHLRSVGGLALNCTALGRQEILAHCGFFWKSRLRKEHGQMRRPVVFGPEKSPWDPRGSFFSMAGSEPCRSTYQLYTY